MATGRVGRGDRREREQESNGDEGCDMISILKLSQASIGNRISGKQSDLSPSSNNKFAVEGKKRGRKRKALAGQYTSFGHAKRRKLGLSTFKDNARSLPVQESNHKPSDLKDSLDSIKAISHVLHSDDGLPDPQEVVNAKAIEGDLKHESSELKKHVDACKNIEGSDSKDPVSLTQPQRRPRGRPRKIRPPVDTGVVNLKESLKVKPSTSYHGFSPEVLSSDLSNLKVYKGDVSNSKKLDFISIAEALELGERPGAVSEIRDTYREVSESVSNRKGVVKVKSCSKVRKATSFKSGDEDKNLPNDLEHKGVDKVFFREGEHKHPVTPQRSNSEKATYEKNYSNSAKGGANAGIPGVKGNGTPNHSIPSDGRSLRPRRWMKREPESKLLPADYVGKRVVVYWPHAKAWFAGIVVEYDERSKKHKINYDDSDEECISFRRHKVMLEEPLDAQSAGDKYAAEKEDISVQKSESQNFRSDIKQLANGLEDGHFNNGSVILASSLPSHRPGEFSAKITCNSSVICPSKDENCASSPSGGYEYCRSTDGSATEGFPEKERVHESVTSSSVENIGMHDAERDKKIEFVYVRKPKTSRKVQAPFADGDQPDLAQVSLVRDNGDLFEEVRQHATSCTEEDLSLSEHKNQTDYLKMNNIPLHMMTDGKPYDQLDSSNSWNISHPGDVNVPFAAEAKSSAYTTQKMNIQSLKQLVNRTFKIQESKSSQGLLIAKESYDNAEVCRARRHVRKRVEKMCRLHCLNVNASGYKKLVLKFRKISSKSSVDSVTTLISKMEAEDEEAKIYDVCNDQLVYKSRTVFQITIRLLCPIINTDLFTWQFFNILVGVGFCSKGSFEDRICIKGSVHDFLGILRLLLSIIKAMSTMSWIYKISHNYWQAQILYQLWSVLSGRASWSDLHGNLPAKAESILAKHLWSACINSKMTTRQILDVLISYFIRPYIISTVCEKGALFKAVFEEFMLLKPKPEGTLCIGKSEKCFQLQLGCESADSVFSSYLMEFLELKNWWSEEGIFLEQMRRWVASASLMGYSKLTVPVPAVRRRNHQVLQLTTVHLANSMFSSPLFKRKAFLVKYNGASFHRILDQLMQNLYRFKGDGTPLRRSISACGNGNLYSTLHLMLQLNRKLHHQNQLLRKADLNLEGRVCQSDKAHLSETCILPMRKEVDARSNVIVEPMESLALKCIKLEPDANISRRSSSITSDSNSLHAMKEESSIEMYGQKLLLDTSAQEPDLKGRHDVLLCFKEERSGQVDHDYYVHKKKRDVKKGKNRTHRNDQSHQNRMKMTRYAVADLVIMRGNAAWRGKDAKVKLQLTKQRECFVVVNQGCDMYVQKVDQGSNVISSNPPQLVWKSDDDWALEFCDKGQWDIFRRMYNGFVQRTAQVLPVKSLPIPGIKLIEDAVLPRPGSFSRPRSAIIQTSTEIESALRNNRILYDLDSEDEAWLDEYNREHSSCNGDDNSNTKSCITDDVLERVIDLLEKEAYRQKEDSIGDNEDSIEITDALRLYQDLAPADVVQAIHTYWLTKRRKKGKALVRHFQPSPREQYEKQLKNWEMMIAECPSGQQKMLMERFPRPQISAFCLECKDSVDRSKKMLRQRSQKKLKPSRSSSEDSHRALGFLPNDYSAWHLSYPSQQSRPPFTPCRSHGQVHGNEASENVQKARARAVAARKVAAMKTAKFRKRFLDFDATLQKAWALLIEYEASMGTGDDLMVQSEAMKAKIELLFSWCSQATAQGNKSSSDDEPPSDVTKSLEEDFLEAFTNKCSIMEEASRMEEASCIEVAHEPEQMLITHEGKEPEQKEHMQHEEAKEQGEEAAARDAVLEEVETSPLLPISTKVYPYAWIGSTLLQEVDQQK